MFQVKFGTPKPVTFREFGENYEVDIDLEEHM